MSSGGIMKISEKILMDRIGLENNGPITIVAFGDSVTHGAVGPNEFNYETVYHNLLKKKINALKPYVPVNVINAGIGGTSALHSLARMESQVFKHQPDLVIVCFGLNDVNGPLEEYISSLEIIFKRCLEFGCETIFMTPNMLNTYVTDTVSPQYKEYAAKTAEYQNGGRMDTYINTAIDTAKKLGVPVCDCYGKWKELSKTADVTKLLANSINHPKSELHNLFADSLFEIIFKEEITETSNDSTMFRG